MSHPVCPYCGSNLVRNKLAPGRLICRTCNLSFDENRISSLWNGTGYSIPAKNVRNNVNYPSAHASSLLDELWEDIWRNEGLYRSSS